MKVMTNVAFHIKVHGLFISGLDAVAKADNAPGSFLIICCDIAVGAICRCYIISIEEFAMCCNKLSKTHIEQLKALGAFAGMAETSQITLF